MTNEIARHRINTLSDLLDSERKALLSGELNRLADMLKPKESLIDALNSGPQDDPDGLRRLEVKVKHNQLLLGGALEGIRAVAIRMAQLRQVQSGLETYGADGKKRTIDVQEEPTTERRA